MDHHRLLDYCLSQPGAEAGRTASGHHDEVRVGGEVFAVFGPEAGTVTLKCGRDADEAAWWRTAYPDDVLIAPYIGHYGWNTFDLSADIPDAEFHRAVDTSYEDVVQREAAGGDGAGDATVTGEATS
jgi:predicted DNA-binding protein (MmcQ/YjbR family)